MTPFLGRQFGNYHLTQLLGRGGFADVYLGEHVHLQTPAAIKVLHTRLGPDDLESFRSEARTIARLRHPHIIRVLEFDLAEGTPFLVMDYASGGTLRKLHPKGAQLSLATILPWVQQVGQALSYAHTQRLIHRDVKPENMLLDERNQVLLSDFGIATLAHSSRSQHTEKVAGTAAYMAPEQIQGKPKPASDQYSLGIVVYEWLSGSRPFDGSSTELCTQHLFAPVPPLRARVPTLAPKVEQVIGTALAKDPQERFGSVQAFVTALEEAAAGPDVRNTAASVSGEGGVVARRQEQSVPAPLPGHDSAPFSSAHQQVPEDGTQAYQRGIESDGIMFGFHAQNTRTNPYEQTLNVNTVAHLKKLWIASTGSSKVISSSPVVASGSVYVGSEDHKLSAFDARTGEQQWATTTGGRIFSSPAVASGSVYVRSRDYKLYAFDARTGKLLWAVPTGGSSSPTVANGVVYVSGGDERCLIALDARSGEQKWVASIDRTEESFSPAVASGMVYMGSWDYQLSAFDARSEEQKWAVRIDGAISTQPAVASGMVYVASRERLYAFDALTGHQKWATKTYFRGGGDSSPAVANGVVYISRGSELYAFDAATGRQKWVVRISYLGSVHSSPMVANGVVYACGGDGDLYALDAKTGKEIWVAPTGGGKSSPMVANGMVYIGAADGDLYAFGLQI